MVSCLSAFSSLLAFISSVSTTSESSFFRSLAASSVNLQNRFEAAKVVAESQTNPKVCYSVV